jgi:hypothetical protein
MFVGVAEKIPGANRIHFYALRDVSQRQGCMM